MRINPENLEPWDGWSQYLPFPSFSAEENLVFKVAYAAIDEVVNQFIPGPKKGYNTENLWHQFYPRCRGLSGAAQVLRQLRDLHNNATPDDYYRFNIEYCLPPPSGPEEIRFEISFYYLGAGAGTTSAEGFSKMVVIDDMVAGDEVGVRQYVLGN